ncbi:hypothetical protein ACEQ8H_003275 [Pleosporales sp. CAS-2024a]
MASTEPVPPTLSLLYRMTALLGDRFSLGPIPTGADRVVIPIIGGTFSGPRMNGSVLNLGADWRLTDAQGALRPEARYALRTLDGASIVVETEGFPVAADADGRTMLRAKFEAGAGGPYAWLNDVVGVGVLTREGTAAVRIDMWHVSAHLPEQGRKERV